MALALAGAVLSGRNDCAGAGGTVDSGAPNQNARGPGGGESEVGPLRSEVDNLRVYEQRRIELQSEMEALQKQLATLQTIVPDEKQMDQFIIMLQTAAATSGVSIRRITPKPVVARDFHYDMPFELEADGPYFSVIDFFTKLSRLSRIINVGDLKLSGLSQNVTVRFPVTAGTTVTGTMTVTTFFSQPAETQPPAPAGPAKH